jgi:tetratricopeptide (TPR) repeat protein
MSRADLPLVARDAELAVLRGALEAAQRGVGSAVCIVGAGGIGKTRLTSEALRIARQTGFRCAWGAGWAEGGVPPLWPWQSVLSQLGRPDVRLGAPSDQSEHERFATFRAVAETIVAAAAQQPVLIVIDDAHTADAGALLLTRFLVRTLRATPVHIVITARDTSEVEARTRAALEDLARDTTVIHPSPLTAESLDQLLRHVGRVASEVEVAEMLELTGGNPLFVGELLAAGASTPTAKNSATDPATGAVTADSLRGLLLLRLNGLPPQACEILAVAAMLGPLAATPTVLAAADVDDLTGRALLRAAERAGMLGPPHDDHCVFTHRLLAEALLALRPPAELARLHSRIADVLEKTRPGVIETVLATAHHRVAAAGLRHDGAHAVAALGACRRAAASLVAGHAYEAASNLLARAVDLHGTAGLAAPTSLLIDVARADLAAGNLRGARSWFRRAADQADDVVDLAEAAVGLGGIWVHEHRSAAEHAAFMALLERAQSALGDARPDLAARLWVRTAAELIYTGHGSHDEVHDAVQAARIVAEPAVLAEALSLWHHTLLGPANTGAARLRIADELVRVAASAGDDMLGLMGLLWRSIDLLLMGDQRAYRALTEVRERADALQVAAVLFVLDAIDVMRQLRGGDIEAAEQAAQRCFELGSSIGDADAVGYLGGHLLTIRWLQARPDEILPLARSVASSPTLVEGDVAPQAAAAVLAAMVGDDDQARADLRQVMTGLPRSERTSSNWMITMFCAAEAALLLGDLKTAEVVYTSLLPYRHLPIMGSVGVVCLGSAERSLGVAARALGDVNLAVHHFEQALDQNHRLQHHVMVAIVEGELGCALIERACPGDVAAGRSHVTTALTALRTLGLAQRAAMLSDAVDRLLQTVPVPDGQIVQLGAVWRLTYGDHAVEIADSVGAQRLRHLLANPWTDLPAADLAGAADVAVRHDVNDTATLRAYRERIDEMRREIDEAEHDHDIERAAAIHADLDDLLEHLGPTIGLRGRTRAFADTGERARVAVKKSLGRVFDAIAEQDAEFARGLDDSVRTGAICRFEPRAHFPSVWHTAR